MSIVLDPRIVKAASKRLENVSRSPGLRDRQTLGAIRLESNLAYRLETTLLIIVRHCGDDL